MQMLDTDGFPLPSDSDGCWDLSLWGDGEVSLAIPKVFDLDVGGSYDGVGVIATNLRDLLHEYYQNHQMIDDGAGLQPLADLLAQYADLYRDAARPA